MLDLPSGSKAVSPTICVTSDYPTARAMVRDVVGSEGVFFYVSYEGTPTWNKPKNTGQIHGVGTAWTLSTPVTLQPSQNTLGWQPMRITLVPGGKTSRFQLYNLYIDPRARYSGPRGPRDRGAAAAERSARRQPARRVVHEHGVVRGLVEHALIA